MIEHVILGLISFVALVYVGVQLVRRYRAASGPVGCRLWAALRDSATVAVSYVAIVISALLGLLAQVPEFAGMVHTLIPPQYAPYWPLAVAVLVYLARLRSLDR